MTAEERIITVAAQMNHDAVIRTTWDLIFTDRRVIAVKTASGSDVAAAFGILGVIGSVIAGRVSRERSKALQQLSLPEILSSSDDKEFFDYVTLESIAFRPKRLFSSRIVIKQRAKRSKKYWGKHRNVIHVSTTSNVLRQCGAPVK